MSADTTPPDQSQQPGKDWRPENACAYAPLFNGKFPTGSYFHYLHHRYVTCNFGEATVPLDKWFGRFYDGTGPYRSTSQQAD